ncbi:MAG: undecaprenyl-phosphate glucose phosphotransferase, partial [Rhizobiaceae bacterium]
MNEMDPAHRFSTAAVRAVGEETGKKSTTLNPMARQIASQYRRDSMSPVLASGTMRIVEFGLLVTSGLLLCAAYVGMNSQLLLHYLGITLTASAMTVILLELTDAYEISTLMRPMRYFGRMFLVWSG